MPESDPLAQRIFNIKDTKEFNEVALEIFRFQYENNRIYQAFVDNLNKHPGAIHQPEEIPFFPISLFKTHLVSSAGSDAEVVFKSSGTTGNQTSQHHVKDIEIYRKSFLKGFELCYGKPEDYTILGLLPSYLEREDSSLIYMVDDLIRRSQFKDSGFFLRDYERLSSLLNSLKKQNKKTLLIGVTYALLEFAEQYPLDFPDLILMETGGMKGQRKEMVREEVHGLLKKAFQVSEVHSEYGMTELLSQAYSKGSGVFDTPPWMKVLIRDTNDPLELVPVGRTGGINIIDLANIYSCSFIATQDLGKMHEDGRFEVLGRFDNSDVRGCNLLV
jgi:phenylacetate-coenzyme A ligase PaaK-like adenylate-forming protein